LNKLAINPIQAGVEKITDEAIDAWSPAVKKEAASS